MTIYDNNYKTKENKNRTKTKFEPQHVYLKLLTLPSPFRLFWPREPGARRVPCWRAGHTWDLGQANKIPIIPLVPGFNRIQSPRGSKSNKQHLGKSSFLKSAIFFFFLRQVCVIGLSTLQVNAYITN